MLHLMIQWVLYCRTCQCLKSNTEISSVPHSKKQLMWAVCRLES